MGLFDQVLGGAAAPTAAVAACRHSRWLSWVCWPIARSVTKVASQICSVGIRIASQIGPAAARVGKI
jgi:hypothetical protein